MRRTALQWCAVSSLAILLGATAPAATRPRYGGVVRAQTRADNVAVLTGLVYETLAVLDEYGRPQPNLATSWESQNDGRRWQFHIRAGLKFHDGTPLTPASIVQSFTSRPCDACFWRARAAGDSVIFESDVPLASLPAALCLPQWAVMRNAGAAPAAGTGPFRITSTQAGRIWLDANNEYWRGRPYPDAIELQLGRGLRDQLTDFMLGKAEVIELGPEQVRRISDDRGRTLVSRPVELIAIVINPQKVADARLREAVSLVINRAAINNVLLQRRGEAAGALLPNWISGDAFLFPTAPNIRRARELQAQVPGRPALTIAYRDSDAFLQLVAERVVLNARDAGLAMQTSTEADDADMEVRRIPIDSTDPAAALAEVMANLRVEGRGELDTPTARYNKEREILAKLTVIPIVHLPRSYAFAPRAHNPETSPTGELRWQELWLDAEERKP